MAKNLERELIQAQRRLSGLMEDTNGAIGEVARHGYNELNQRPWDGNDMTQKTIWWSSNPPPAFLLLPKVVIDRITAEPTKANPFLLEDISVRVLSTSTGTVRRQQTVRGRTIASLPISQRSVRIDFDRIGESRERPHIITISANGGVNYDGDPDYTYPTAVARPSLISQYGGYKSPESLISNYSFAFQGAIGATLFVADSLSQIHGINSDTSELPKLQAAWRRQSPREMHPGIAVLLPRKSR